MPVVEIAANVPTTLSLGVQVLTTVNPFIAAQNNAEFTIDLSAYTALSSGGTAPVSLNDGTYTLPLMDKKGYNIHSDRLLREIMQRSSRAGFFDVNEAPAEVSLFRAVVATDPNRIVILDHIPRSTFIGSLSTSANPT